MATDGEAATEIGRQIALMRRRVAQRGVLGYLDERGERKDVNKLFLGNTVRSVDAHNRRHEEAKCWKIRGLEEKLDKRSDRRRRSRSRSRSDSRRRRDRSRSRNGSRGHKRRRRSSSRSEERRGDGRLRVEDECRDRSSSRSRRERKSKRRASRKRSASTSPSPPPKRGDGESERDYWARKKAEKTEKMWEKLHSGGSVTVENAPTFRSDDDDDDDDVKVRKPKKKSKKHSSC